MESQSEVQSSHNSSQTTNVTVYSWDDLTDGQQLCLEWADEQDWDRIKGYAKEHGPEVLLGVYTKHDDAEDEVEILSVLSIATYHDNAEMVKFTLEAGFDNMEAMCLAAIMSINTSANSTILRLLLEHGPEVLLGVHKKRVGEKWAVASVLTAASIRDNVEMVKLTLEAGFDNKEAMCMAACLSMKNSDNSTILRLLLEHGLDKRIII